MGMYDIGVQITDAVRRWDGVEVVSHRPGSVEFRVGHREMGHLHGNRQMDLPFPFRVRRALVAAGRAKPHHALPNTGWVSFHMRTEHDIPAAVKLLRLNYERLRHGADASAVRPMFGTATILNDRSIDDFPA